MKKIILLISFVVILTTVANAVDSTFVRIKVDVDQASLQINDKMVLKDSYGNQLLKNSWFILNLPLDTYNIKIYSDYYDPVDSNIILVKDEIYILDIKFIEVTYEDTAKYFTTIPENIESIKIVLKSDPDSTEIFLDKEALEQRTPLELFLRPGEYLFQVKKEGYEPLRSSIVIETKIPVDAFFRLKTAKPPDINADSLGMTYSITMPMLDKRQANKIKKQYYSMAESFAIFPLAQGILAHMAVDDSQRGKADALLISGVILTGGSYLLGKILSERKRKYIFKENKRRTNNNAFVAQKNSEIDETVREENATRLKKWLLDNRGRGKVEIISDKNSSLE